LAAREPLHFRARPEYDPLITRVIQVRNRGKRSARGSERTLHTACIELASAPSVPFITSTRRFVEEFFADFIDQPDETSRLALTAHELLENLAKHSSGGAIKLEISLALRGRQGIGQIRTRNRTDLFHRRDLADRIRQIRAAEDPFAVYVECLARTSDRPESSGLGLARIRAEAEMSLSYEIRGTAVTIVAETPVSIRSCS
jgi:hypothetical protein